MNNNNNNTKKMKIKQKSTRTQIYNEKKQHLLFIHINIFMLHEFNSLLRCIESEFLFLLFSAVVETTNLQRTKNKQQNLYVCSFVHVYNSTIMRQ